jgi:hypothetical protein
MASTINATPTSSGLIQTADNSGVLALQTGGTTAVTVDASQNVGIGNTSPASFASTTNLALGTGSSGAALTVYTGTAQTGAVYFADGTTSADRYRGAIEYSHSSNALLFTTDASERMRITSGGVLLLNETSTGSAPLMQISADTTNYNNLVIKDTGTTYSTGNRFALFTNSSNAVAGQIQHTGVTTTAFATSSDQRLKENIVDAPNALDKVMDLKVRSYDWKEDNSHVEYGLVAQEVNAVYGEPIGVGGDDVKSDPWNIEYGRLTPILLKAIQELNAKVDAQALEIQALKGVA